MKVIAPVHSRTRLAEGFNSAAGICICDLSADPSESCTFGFWKDIIPQGAKIAARFRELGIHSVLATRMQLLALNFFTAGNIEVYKSLGDNLQENLDLMRQRKLEHYTPEEALQNGSLCSGACAACGSSDCDSGSAHK